MNSAFMKIDDAGKEHMGKEKYIDISIETTGLWYLTDKITRISLVMQEEDEIINRFESLVNPEIDIPDFVAEITGISNEMVASAPCLKDVLLEVLELIGDAPLVAHNAKFVQGFINEALKSIGQDGVRLRPH